jgi:hypothetical protein
LFPLNLLEPDPDGPQRLADEITAFFSQLDFVQRVMAFGSLAGQRWDRWSDLDLIVVTASHTQYRMVFHRLCAHKPVVHHGVFTSCVEPAGGYVLGIVFEGESVFHCLDLNFLTLAEYRALGTLDRFGATRDLYVNEAGWADEADEPPQHRVALQHPDEARIYDAIHWTKKSAKKMLRGQDTRHELRACAERLRAVMNDYPDSPLFPGGDICRLAHTYLLIADQLLN